MKLTGKALYEVASAHLKKEGYEDIDWDIALTETQSFYTALAEQLNSVHIQPLQVLTRDLYNTIDTLDAWDKLTDTWYESLQKRFSALCGEKEDAHTQNDTVWLSQLLEGTAQQLESIAQENVSDPKALADARRRFMGVLQPVFYMLGRHYPELESVLSRIGRAFVEV